jgi:hypothetical protein
MQERGHMRRPVLTKLYGSIIHADPAPPSFKDNSDYLTSITLETGDRQRLIEFNRQRREEKDQRSLEKRNQKKILAKARKRAVHLMSAPLFRQRLDRCDYPTEEEIRLAYEPLVAKEIINILVRKQLTADK